jgi:hypothetical protein
MIDLPGVPRVERVTSSMSEKYQTSLGGFEVPPYGSDQAGYAAGWLSSAIRETATELGGR